MSLQGIPCALAWNHPHCALACTSGANRTKHDGKTRWAGEIGGLRKQHAGWDAAILPYLHASSSHSGTHTCLHRLKGRVRGSGLVESKGQGRRRLGCTDECGGDSVTRMSERWLENRWGGVTGQTTPRLAEDFFADRSARLSLKLTICPALPPSQRRRSPCW